MDVLTLVLTGKLTSEKLSRPRTVLSAALGGLIGTAAMFLLDGIPFVVCGLFTAVLMTRTAFGTCRGILPLVRRICGLR